ncbi:hypothetical protein [Nonomuraea sp. NPDC003754]
MSADDPSAEETGTAVEVPDHGSGQPSTQGPADSVEENQPDPSHEELRELADQQEAELVANDNESAEAAYHAADMLHAEPDGSALSEDRDPTHAELKELAEQQDDELATETATDEDAAGQPTGPPAENSCVEDEPRQAVTDDQEPAYEHLDAGGDERDAVPAAEAGPDSGDPESRVEGNGTEGQPSVGAIHEEPQAVTAHEEIGLDEQAEGDVEQPFESDLPSDGQAQEPGPDDDPTYEELRALAEHQDAELARDGEDLASPDSSDWAERVPRFEQAWREHEARWPQKLQAVEADRTGDEPGSWRGDGGQYLNAEENIVTGHHYDRVADARPKVTDAITEIRPDVPGAELVGLEYQLKGADRYKEKVAEGLALGAERTVEQVTAKIPDALRYTYQFHHNDYVDGYREVCQRLEERGYELEFSRNSWSNAEYKGINSRWRTPDGQMFEVQFHAPESFQAKQLTHGAYERQRNPRTTHGETEELRAFQAEVSSRIPVPEHVDEVPDYRKKRS